MNPSKSASEFSPEEGLRLFAPIALYPGRFRSIAEASPFAASLYWPAAQVTNPSAHGFIVALAWQALWIALLVALVAVIWRAGLRKVLREGL